jgi:hypothetical protein
LIQANYAFDWQQLSAWHVSGVQWIDGIPTRLQGSRRNCDALDATHKVTGAGAVERRAVADVPVHTPRSTHMRGVRMVAIAVKHDDR